MKGLSFHPSFQCSRVGLAFVGELIKAMQITDNARAFGLFWHFEGFMATMDEIWGYLEQVPLIEIKANFTEILERHSTDKEDEKEGTPSED